MKCIKFLVATALFMAATAAPIAPAAADQTSNNGANAELHEFCTGLVASGIFPDLNYGECMSYNRTSLSGLRAHVCDQLRETGELDDYGFSSYSECVRNIEF